MRVLTVFFLFSLTVVKSQRSLQGDYNHVFSASEDVRRNGQDNVGLMQRSGDITQAPESRFRLSNTVLPLEYTLRISPIIDDGQQLGPRWTTPGDVRILVQCQEATQSIHLHSKAIVIDFAATKVLDGATELVIANQDYEPLNSFFYINLTNPLQTGQNYAIELKFVSLISEELNGLYQSKYTDPTSGEEIWLATTQMEALHARQMFPCFDEPALKATFDVTIGRRDIHLALFNTESVSNTTMEGVDGWVWEKFAPTVKMPTYLLALIISVFTYSEATGNALEGKNVRTYAPKHYIDDNWGTYAAEVADKMLAFFEVYYDEIYPLSKMDSAAVPDFFFGAMENWGLNIYRESALLYLEGESNEAERFTVTRILGHELAHQWFGNLVTANFWTHIWLNEGFATYVAALAVEAIHPEYQPWERFQNDAVQAAMLFDARPEVSHSIKIDEDVWPTKDAMSWFDRISYEKGGSLIRMMNGFLTEETMKNGLRRYLDNKKYEGAVQDELFSNLDFHAQADNRLPAGLTMKDIMDTWTLQKYFPLLKVSRASASRIYISQQIFSNNVGQQAYSVRELDPNHMWHVPVSIASANNPDFDPMPEVWVEKNIALKTHTIDTNQWIIANAGATGYYRVLYDTGLTNLIRQQLLADHLVINSSVTRSQLLDDYFMSAFQGIEVSIETALQLAEYLGKETEIVVWNTAFNQLRKASYLLQDNSLRMWLLPKVSSAMELIGGAGATVSPGMTTLRHLQFLDWNCALEGPECESFTSTLYEQWKATPATNPIRVDIRPTVYCAIVSSGEEEGFNFIKDRYNDNTISAKQKGLLLNSLGCAKSTPVLDGVLENVLNDDYDIPKSAKPTLLQRLALNVLARPKVISYFRANAQAINDYFTNANAMVNAVSSMGQYMGSVAERDLITQLRDENVAIFGTRLDSTIQVINGNIQWMSDFGNRMSDFFKS